MVTSSLETSTSKSLQSFTSDASRAMAFQRHSGRWLLAVILCAFASVPAHTQEFTSIVVFGDSLSDAGNVAHLMQEKYGLRMPGPVINYTDGRYTDGYDTIPGAQNYVGTWVEQLAAALPSKPVVKASLDGGTDYAYGFATTGSGTGIENFGPYYVVNVNIGQQITDYLATKPKIHEKTLFVVWGGAIDILYASLATDITNAAINQTVNIQRLIDAGARNILVANLPPLGLVPRLNSLPALSAQATQAAALYNHVLSQGLDVVSVSNTNKHLSLYRMDVFALFTQIVASPTAYSLTNVTGTSQFISGLNPDTYLFWDDLHPTTKGHDILAITAAKLLDSKKCWGYQWPYALAESERACDWK